MPVFSSKTTVELSLRSSVSTFTRLDETNIFGNSVTRYCGWLLSRATQARVVYAAEGLNSARMPQDWQMERSFGAAFHSTLVKVIRFVELLRSHTFHKGDGGGALPFITGLPPSFLRYRGVRLNLISRWRVVRQRNQKTKGYRHDQDHEGSRPYPFRRP